MSAYRSAELAPQTVVDNLETAVVCLDGALAIIFVNPAGEMLFGVSARFCQSQPFDKALPGLGGHRERLEAALATGAAYTERELDLGADGENALIVDCVVTPVSRPDGRAILLLEFVSLGRRLRISQDDQMLSQNRSNREMIRGLAHEIKNPLGGLRGAAQLLEREISDDRLRQYTAVIVGEADRLRDLVDSMLGPRRPPDKRPLNVHEPLEHVRGLIATELAAGIAVRRDYDPSIPLLRADRAQLVQTFFNLIGNAVTAVGEAGTITLRSRTQRLLTIGREQHRLVARIDVIDDGPGISRELLARIFHPMVSSRGSGSGMGLPIAQHLVQGHRGLIECTSRPGRTVFSVFLPLEADDARA